MRRRYLIAMAAVAVVIGIEVGVVLGRAPPSAEQPTAPIKSISTPKPTSLPSFILIKGAEESSTPLHLLVLNATKPPANEMIQQRIDDINAQGGVAIIAHPGKLYSRYSDNVSEIMALKGYLGMELFEWKGNWWGIWDTVLTDRVAKGEPLVWGFMTDDTHRRAEGMGWRFVVARAPGLSLESILAALRAGSFYYGSGAIFNDISLHGAIIEDISLSRGTITLKLSVSASDIRFIKQGGQVVKITSGTYAQYHINGDEGYIRIEARASGRIRVGTQPFRIVDASNVSNPYATSGQWYKCNLHTHTIISDGDMPPEEIIKWYSEHDYSVLAITDHVPWQVPLEAMGYIRGNVVYKGKLPARAVTYEITPWPEGTTPSMDPVPIMNVPKAFTIDASGVYRYTIPYLPDGDYGVGAAVLRGDLDMKPPFKPGDIVAVGFYPQKVTVAGHQPVFNINFSIIDCRGTISGNIGHNVTPAPDATKAPVRVRVSVQQSPSQPFFLLYSFSTPQGSYTIPGIPDGKIVLFVWLDSDNDGNPSRGEPQGRSEEIPVSGGSSIQGINIALK